MQRGSYYDVIVAGGARGLAAECQQLGGRCHLLKG